MKIYSLLLMTILITICVLPQQLTAQDCEAVAAVPNISSDCTDPDNPVIAFDGTFAVEHSGTSAMEYIFSAPADENGDEEVIWVSSTLDLDMNDDGTGNPFPFGTYSVTPFAFDAEDLMALSSNSVILTLVDCLEGDGSDSLEEVLSCIESTEGLFEGVLTVDLVQSNVLDSVAPLLLQYDMCYELGEKIEFIYAESCASGIEEPNPIFDALVNLESMETSTYRLRKEVSNSFHSLELYSNVGQLVTTFSNDETKIELSALPTGTYFLIATGDQWRQSQKLIRF